MSLVDRCRAMLGAQVESASLRAIDEALAAAARDDAGAACAAIGRLDERGRFVAMVVLGVLAPSIAGPLAAAVDASIAQGAQVVDWRSLCERALVRRWAIANAGAIEPALLGKLVHRTHPTLAAWVVLAVVRHELAAGHVDTAIALHATTDRYAKHYRATARAAIGIATRDDVHLRLAVREADIKPVIEAGGEECEALAAVLAELAPLPPKHAAVVAAVRRLVAWGRRSAGTDRRSFHIADAAIAAAAAGWLEHARALAAAVRRKELKTACAKAIAKLEAGKRPVHRAKPDELDAEPALEDIDARVELDKRAAVATLRIEHRIAAGDLDSARTALRRLFAIGATGAPPAPDCDARVAWARALDDSGDRAGARAILSDIVRQPGHIALATWKLAARICEPPEARAAVARALTDDVVLQHANRTRDPFEVPAAFVAELAVRTGVAAVELDVLTAAAATHGSEGRDGSDPWQRRVKRITGVLRVLDRAHPDQLASWQRVLRKEPWLLAAAVTALSRADDAHAIVGTVRDEHGPALAAAFAGAGRCEDAIATARALSPWTQLFALEAAAEAAPTATDRAKIVAAWQRWPKPGRDRGAQMTWRHGLGTVQLAAGDFDGAIATARAMQDSRMGGRDPGSLVSAIANRLDEAWTFDRGEALCAILAGPTTIPQDLPGPIRAVVPTAVARAPRAKRARVLALTAQIAAKFRSTGDQSLVDAAVGLGLARAGAPRDATVALEAAIARAVRERLLFVDASALVHCVAGAAVPDRERLWFAAFEVARVHRVDAAKRAVIAIVDHTAPADASLVARALATDRLPREVLDAARDRLAERIADEFDDGDLLPLDAIDDALTTHRRIRQAARWLARHRQLAEARELAAAVGLA